MVALLCDDNRVYFLDLDRNYSIVCALAPRHKVTDIVTDKCSNLLVCLTSEGDLELHRTKTLLAYDFVKKGEELRKGGESLAKVQTILSVVERGVKSPTSKPSKSKPNLPLENGELVIVDDVQLLRENWVPQTSMTFNLKDLRTFLKRHSVFPEAHRGVVYTYLLSLPKNVLAYDNLSKKGVHQAFHTLEQTFPLKSPVLGKKLGRVLSALAHHCPLFGDKSIVPFIAFPFVKLFEGDECLAFEMVLIFMMHWGQHLVENYPHPSTTLIEYSLQTLGLVDPELSQFFRAHDVRLGDYLWTSWTNLYTDLLPRTEWLLLFDHLVAYPEYPELFILLAVTELLTKREAFIGNEKYR